MGIEEWWHVTWSLSCVRVRYFDLEGLMERKAQPCRTAQAARRLLDL